MVLPTLAGHPTSSNQKPPGRLLSDDFRESLPDILAAAARFLPSQGPIETFVHHNTLHCLESKSFHEAIAIGQKRFDAEGYLSEDQYRHFLKSGRISKTGLQEIIREELGESAPEFLAGLSSREKIRSTLLQHVVHCHRANELRWLAAEHKVFDRFEETVPSAIQKEMITSTQMWLKSHATEADQRPFKEFFRVHGSNADVWPDAAWQSFSLRLLWQICREKTRDPEPHDVSVTRLRDHLRRLTGNDTDRSVHEILIRFTAAFVDQGYSDWNLPDRDKGFFEAFLTVYGRPSKGLDQWLWGLSDELQSRIQSGMTCWDSIFLSLQEFGIDADDVEEVLTQSLLSLRGWAGMLHQLQTGPQTNVHRIPEHSVAGFLAVYLILEKQALTFFGQAFLQQSAQFEEIRDHLIDSDPQFECSEPRSVAFPIFQLAQHEGWTPQQLLDLDDEQWTLLSNEVSSFDEVQRRRIFHEAYERQYLEATLDAFAAHAKVRSKVTPPWIEATSEHCPSFQLMTCIDDREESFRRHLEEVDPTCETFGAAGFFAVAMYYRGVADGFYQPLCPGVITPDHYVQEDIGYTFEGVHRGRAQLRKRLGLATHVFHTRSRTFVGGIFAGILGSLATAPLVARVLFPRLTSHIRQRFGSLLQPPPVTNLHLERHTAEPGSEDKHIGYTVKEMANVVVRLLEDIGQTNEARFSRLFIVCGHGSSSLNNPHESAYCCGACAGKRGGPNARAFAEMANDWRVRSLVAELGICIPESTFFIGAYHNTCDDSVVFFDLDRMPASHRNDFDEARITIEEARKRNAHERCRRFVSASLTLSPEDALRHVEGRAQDISQARPEYNHATNAMCVVGRRDWTRGLFLDRRAFLTSYDPTMDDEQSSVLFRILSAAIPVCAGINLEYYFSCVDPATFGSGSKLPHNIVSLLGVMEGTASDLRTGLYQQMVEIHEPLRLLFVIESTPEALLSIIERSPGIGQLCRGEWVYLAVIDSETSQIQLYRDGKFGEYQPRNLRLQRVASSRDCYDSCRDHRPFFSIAENEVAS